MDVLRNALKRCLPLFLLVVAPVNAGIYKWTDSNGNVHFGDRPANMDTATEVQIQTNKNTGVTNSSGNTKEREYLLKKIEEEKTAEAEKRKAQAAKDKKRQARCDAYRSRFQRHIQSHRSYTMSPDGERTYLTAEQREQRKKKLGDGVAKYCR